MSKNLIILIAVTAFLITSCKKDPITVNSTATTRTLDFKASSADTMGIVLIVMRPTGLKTGVTSLQIEGTGSDSVLTPYEFISTKLRPGDNVYVLVKYSQAQPLNTSLTINGVSVPYTSSDNSPAFPTLTWNFYVK